MAKGNIAACLPITLAFEGGMSKNSKDPGNWTGGKVGKGVLKGTNLGIAAASYPSLDIAKLTVRDVTPIYKRNYWDAAGCETLLPGVDLVTFDGAVNSGVSRSKKWLASAIGGDGKSTIQKYCKARLGFVRGLKTWTRFGKGWSRRIASVEASAVRMFLGNSAAANAELKLEAGKAAVAAKKNEQAASGVSVGGAGAGGADLVAGDPSWLFWGVAGVALIVVVAILIARRSHNNERAKAYALAADE